MRRIPSLILILVMVMGMCFQITACSKKDRIIVGAIYINSKDDKAGYTFAHHSGITKAMAQLGIPDEDLKIIDNVPEDEQKVRDAIDRLTEEGADIIFGISFGYTDAFVTAAKEYPDVVFCHATGIRSNDRNFVNYFGRIYQARYLAGIAAGFKSLELGNNNIGYVTAWGTEYAETCSGINAFALGVRSVNPEATVYVNKISAWGDAEKERKAAEDLIDKYDCCVIAQHCDSAEPQIVAQEKGVFGCGYNSDMAEQAPDAHLTAPIWNWDVFYKLAIETALNNAPGNFSNIVGNYYGGLKEGVVGISELTSNCAPGTESAIMLARHLITSGEWDVFSGTALEFTYDGVNVTVSEVGRDLLTNNGKYIVIAGDGAIDDSIIRTSMDYYVEGVVPVN